MPDTYCKNCRCLLSNIPFFEILPWNGEEHTDESEYRLAFFYVPRMTLMDDNTKSISDFVAMLLSTFPGLKIHRAVPCVDRDAYSIQASYETFPVSKGDAFCIPEVKLSIEREYDEENVKYVISSMEFVDV